MNDQHDRCPKGMTLDGGIEAVEASKASAPMVIPGMVGVCGFHHGVTARLYVPLQVSNGPIAGVPGFEDATVKEDETAQLLSELVRDFAQRRADEIDKAFFEALETEGWEPEDMAIQYEMKGTVEKVTILGPPLHGCVFTRPVFRELQFDLAPTKVGQKGG